MKQKPLLTFLISVFLLCALGFGCKRNSSTVPVVWGTIETDEVHIASRYGGRVEEILAQEGDALKTGQVIVKLEAAELEARRSLAASSLAELEAGPRVEEIAAAKSDYEAMAAELEFARSDAKRARELFATSTVSATDLERATSRAAALEKSVAAAKARYELLRAGTRRERIDQARAQLAEIDAQLREMKISAPTNSILEVLQVKAGDVLAPNREVATLLLSDHLWVRVYVPARWLGHIKIGETVRVQVDSFPREEFQGEVEQISRSAEFTPRNVQTVEERIKQVFAIKVRLLNPEGKLRAGMSADLLFPGIPSEFHKEPDQQQAVHSNR